VAPDGGGRPVELELNIVNQTYPEGRTQYNVVAEIPGTDKAAEVVMLGGHLDSWHAATGATDNAIGCATMMEAIRVLNAIGVKPRRTIRVALWSGEEQGLLGSQAYVKEHFGTFESPKPEYANFAGYFNIDSGTGRARGMTVFGPPEAAHRPARRHEALRGQRLLRRHRPPRAAAAAARITRRSTRSACPASACSRTRSSTARTPGTPTSTPTSASSRTMRGRARW
jgi:Zn-dependent M28 family amino/carboxypeptidase